MSWLPKKSVVVPVDFSQSSLQAICVARELVEVPSQVHVVHVIQPLHVAEPGMMWGTVTDAERMQLAEDALRKELSAEHFNGITSQVELGSPAHRIADVATEIGAELIVIPSHGRSGFSRVFLGSVTEKVLRLATCPVLVLRTEEGKRDEE